MNAFESTIVAALRDEAQEIAMSADLNEGRDILESRLDDVDRGRRRRQIVGGLTVAAAADLSAALALEDTADLRTNRAITYESLDRFTDALADYDHALGDPYADVDTVEAGFMTKDLALLVGADQRWLSTTGFLDKVAENLTKEMA